MGLEEKNWEKNLIVKQKLIWKLEKIGMHKQLQLWLYFRKL